MQSNLEVKDVIGSGSLEPYDLKFFQHFVYTKRNFYVHLRADLIAPTQNSDKILILNPSPKLLVYNIEQIVSQFDSLDRDQEWLQWKHIPVSVEYRNWKDVFPLIQKYYGKAPLMPMVHLFRHMNAFTYFWYALEHYRSIQQEWGLSVKEWPDTFIDQVNQWIDEEDSMITYDAVITDSYYLYGGR